MSEGKLLDLIDGNLLLSMGLLCSFRTFTTAFITVTFMKQQKHMIIYNALQ